MLLLIPKLERANVLCAGASLTIPGLLCNLKHPSLLGALTVNQLAEVQPQVDDLQLQLGKPQIEKRSLCLVRSSWLLFPSFPSYESANYWVAVGTEKIH